MSPFYWRFIAVLSFLFFVFVISTLTLTLLLVNEVKDNNVDNFKLTYVQVANWIYVGLMGLSLLSVIFFTPYFAKYTRRTESIVSTGLKPVTAYRRREAEAEKNKIANDMSDFMPHFL